MSAGRRIGLGLVAAAAAWLLWGWLAVSPEDRVRTAIDELAGVLSAPAADPLGQVTALAQLRQRLADDVVITTGTGAEVRGRDPAAGLWQRVRAAVDQPRVRMFDVSVVMGEDAVSATADGIAELSFERGGTPERELRELRLFLVERDGAWLVERATVVEAVTPPR